MEKVVKLVRTVARQDGHLVLDDGSNQTFGNSYLRLGWSILAVLPGASSNEVVFILQAEGAM